jgi:hypothetical protein
MSAEADAVAEVCASYLCAGDGEGGEEEEADQPTVAARDLPSILECLARAAGEAAPAPAEQRAVCARLDPHATGLISVEDLSALWYGTAPLSPTSVGASPSGIDLSWRTTSPSRHGGRLVGAAASDVVGRLEVLAERLSDSLHSPAALAPSPAQPSPPPQRKGVGKGGPNRPLSMAAYIAGVGPRPGWLDASDSGAAIPTGRRLQRELEGATHGTGGGGDGDGDGDVWQVEGGGGTAAESRLQAELEAARQEELKLVRESLEAARREGEGLRSTLARYRQHEKSFRRKALALDATRRKVDAECEQRATLAPPDPNPYLPPCLLFHCQARR